jgi:hypothetical protein
MADPFRLSLIDSGAGMHAGDVEVRAEQVAPGSPVPWRVRLRRLHGGKQEGVDLLEVDNGRTIVRLIPTRGMGILDARLDDLRLGWDSPVREVVHPSLVNLEARGGTGWLDGFNEYMARCGLEWFGPPGEEPDHLAKSEPPIARMTLHGKITNIPASTLRLEAETRAPWRIRITSTVHERMMYGPKFELQTTFETTPGAEGFSVTDTIHNRGGQSQEFGLLYHLNHGPPLLEAGARWVAPLKWWAPRDNESALHAKNFDRYGAPKTASLEQAFLCKLYGDRKGQTGAVLHNKAGNLGVRIGWPIKALPCFTVWKAEHNIADGYVTGLEPGTGWPLPRPVERKEGRVPRLRAGGSWSATLQFDLLSSRPAVKKATAAIKAIAAGRKTTSQTEAYT